MIIEAFEDAGVPVDELVVAGGLLTNALLMQIYADVTRRPLSLIGSAQGPALGSAIHAAVAAGCYPDVADGGGGDGPGATAGVYLPDPSGPTPTTRSTRSTGSLHDHFGRGGNDVMLRLRGRSATRRVRR